MSLRPELIKREQRGFLIRWEDGHSANYSYSHLRRNCPCAQCRNEPPTIIEPDDPLRLIDQEPIFAEDASLVGNYGVQFVWNDGHRHGIYSFQYLRSICPCRNCITPTDHLDENRSVQG